MTHSVDPEYFETGKQDVLRAALLLARGAVSTECYRLGVVGSFLKSPPAPGAANAKRQPFFGFRPLELIVAAVVLAQDEIASLFFFYIPVREGGRYTEQDTYQQTAGPSPPLLQPQAG